MGSDEQLFGSCVQEAKPKIPFQFYTSPLAFYIDDLFFFQAFNLLMVRLTNSLQGKFGIN